MPVRKTLLRSTVGVHLERVEDVSAHGKVKGRHYLLRTMRPREPRVLTEEAEAQDAFDLEVIASLTDPRVSRLVAGNC